mgnify:CR=1 FL=1
MRQLTERPAGTTTRFLLESLNPHQPAKMILKPDETFDVLAIHGATTVDMANVQRRPFEFLNRALAGVPPARPRAGRAPGDEHRQRLRKTCKIK